MYINWSAVDVAFIILAIALLAVALILIMDCIWRTEGKFDKYLKLIACAFVLLLFKNIGLLFGLRSSVYGDLVGDVLEVASVLFFLFSNIELYIIVRALSGESELKEPKTEE
jgi:hypothetical protein